MSLILQLVNKTLDIAENENIEITLNSIIKLKEKASENNRVTFEKDNDHIEKLENRIKLIESMLLKQEAEKIVTEAISRGKISSRSKEFYLDLCETRDGLDITKQYFN